MFGGKALVCDVSMLTLQSCDRHLLTAGFPERRVHAHDLADREAAHILLR